MLRRVHPFFAAFFVLAVVRACIAGVLFVQAQVAGFAGGVLSLAPSIAMQSGTTLIWGALFAGLHRASRSSLVAFAGATCLLVCAVWTIADPVIFALAGDHLTPSLLAHFAGPRIFTSDYLWRPIAAHPVLSGGAVLLVAGVVAAILALRRILARTDVADARLERRISAGAAASVLVAFVVSPSVEPPPEVVFAIDALRPTGRSVSSDDVRALREFVGLPDGARWLDDRYPLVHKPRERTAPAARPDIVVVSIESMRGADMRWASGREGALVLPTLEGLAESGVVFPRFVSNGFPSTEGFASTTFSAWPHDRRRIVLDFKHIEFDSLASRLVSLGYQTVRVEDDPDLDEEGFWVRRMYSESVTFRDRGLYASERAMVRAIEELIVRQDAERPDEPLFIDWKTAHPHMPYDVPNDALGRDVDLGSPARNYAAGLRYVDAALGELVAFLKGRSRWRDTVLVVVGDHANVLVRSDVTPLPSDDMVWTGALIVGPQQLVGEPRRSPRHASQVDVMPTLLAMVGDTRPTATLGRDLLSDRETRRDQALAIRPGGLRLDASGVTSIFDRRRLSAAFTRRAFTGERMPARTNVDGTALERVVSTWAGLVETNRVWSGRLLR